MHAGLVLFWNAKKAQVAMRRPSVRLPWRGVRDGSSALIEKIEEGDEREAILSRRGITVLTQICSIRSSLEIEIERERGKEGRA
jgi:hypothetical protein